MCVYSLVNVPGFYREFVLRIFYFSMRIRHTRSKREWSSDICSSDLTRVRVNHIVRVHAFAAQRVSVVVVHQVVCRSEEHTSELQSRFDLVCRLLLEKKNRHDTQRYQHVRVCARASSLPQPTTHQR